MLMSLLYSCGQMELKEDGTSRYSRDSLLDLLGHYSYIGCHDSVIMTARPMIDEALEAGDTVTAFYAGVFTAQSFLFFENTDSIKYYIDRNLYQRLRLKDISKTLGFSVRHIIHLFKTETGQTPYDYLLEKRIRLAENLLKNSDMTVSEIAALLHFTDQYHFSRIFKTRTGTAPSVYRKHFSG